jgi:hypothetical protein
MRECARNEWRKRVLARRARQRIERPRIENVLQSSFTRGLDVTPRRASTASRAVRLGDGSLAAPAGTPGRHGARGRSGADPGALSDPSNYHKAKGGTIARATAQGHAIAAFFATLQFVTHRDPALPYATVTWQRINSGVEQHFSANTELAQCPNKRHFFKKETFDDRAPQRSGVAWFRAKRSCILPVFS